MSEAPFLNSQDLFIIKDDYTQVFGKHFVKAGVLASFNAKNEDTDGNGASQHSRFWGSVPDSLVRAVDEDILRSSSVSVSRL